MRPILGEAGEMISQVTRTQVERTLGTLACPSTYINCLIILSKQDMSPAFTWECLLKSLLSLLSRLGLASLQPTRPTNYKTQSRGECTERPCRKRQGLGSHLMAPPAAAAAGSKSRSINLWTQSFRRPQGE